MAKQPLLEPADVSKLITLFDRMYKLGIEDANEHSYDEGLCREHIETTNKPGHFGLIRDGFISDALDWQLTLQKQANRLSIYKRIYRMFIRMGAWAKSTYYSCILPVAQDFYNLGIEDYFAHPNADTLATFMEERRIRWGGKRADNFYFVEKIQEFCGKRMRSEASALDNFVEPRENTHQRISDDDVRRCVLRDRWWKTFRQAVAVVNYAGE